MLYHYAFYEIMLYYIIISSLLWYYYIIIVIIVTITIIITYYHIVSCHYHGMLYYIRFLLYPHTLHPFILDHIIVCYIILYHRWLGPRAPQLIGWATGKDSGATELKTMEHEKASDTWRENNIRTITMQSPIPRFAKTKWIEQ